MDGAEGEGGLPPGERVKAQEAERPSTRGEKRVTTGQVVVVSLVVDVLDVATNLVVAVITGSAVVFAEMAQGAADAIGSAFLLIGHRRSRRPRDAAHPFGYTSEVFFWALLSALMMLVVGAGLSAWRGISQLTRPEPLDHPWLAVLVTLLSVCTNGYAVSRSVKRLLAENRSLRLAFRNTSRQLVKTALLQDSLGTTSAVIGLLSLVGYLVFGAVTFDAVGALVLAGLMVTFAGLLVSQARSFIAGRAIPGPLRDALLRAVREVPEVTVVNRLDAVFAGSEAVIVNVDLDLEDDLAMAEVERAVDRVQAAIRAVVPQTRSIGVDLNSPPRSDA